MATWNGLAGYLVQKPGGAFSRLKSWKRQWYVLDEAQCLLLYFRSEEEARAKAPLGLINIRDAAISLESNNQFTIHSDGKDFTLVADSHDTVMVWVMALQAKRDAWCALHRPPGTSPKDSPQRRREVLMADYEVQAITGHGLDPDKSPFVRKHSLQLNGGPSLRRHLPGSPTMAYSLRQRRKSTFAESRSTGSPELMTPDSGRCQSERGSPILFSLLGFSRRNTPSPPPRRSSTAATPTASGGEVPPMPPPRKSSGGMATRSSSSSSSPSKKDVESPATESAGESDRVTEDDDPKKAATSRGSTPSSPQKRLVTDSVSSLLRKGEETTDPPSQTARLEKLESDLIAAKCELARALNRETAYKTSLEERESRVAHLEGQLGQINLEADDGSQTSDGIPETIQSLRDRGRVLQNHNRFLNEEILKLSRMLQQEQFKNHSRQLRIQELQSELDQIKRDYVFLLQSSIRLVSSDGTETLELYLYGEKRHRQRVMTLLNEARKVNGSLPNPEEVGQSLYHVDPLGFKLCFVDESLILHYLCRLLHNHYTTQLTSYDRHVSAWKSYLRHHETNLCSTKDLKKLVRDGIPPDLRRKVWCALYRTRVQDIRDSKPPNYYSSMCSKNPDTQMNQHQRQISLDLLRTMPNNVRFCDRTADGVQKMQEVLQAFCLHNPTLGYCQGMNFLVGMCLLYMDPEDAFWCLVAIVERYFTPSYFGQNLVGAQADQEVLKDLLKEKLPKLYRHLAALDIELSTITLNWFLAIFFDSVPFETLLRIWDCFLLEGPKVLFRFSLAVLKVQEEAILAKHDTVSIMRQLKAAAKLCFDVEGLVKAAFDEMEPFPRRQEMTVKQACYNKVLQEKARQKEREKQALREREKMMAHVELEGPHNLLIECAAVFNQDKMWLCHGYKHGSRVSIANCSENIIYRLNIEFESRVMCMHAPDDVTMLFGTLAHYVHAFHTISRKLLWEICLNDSVLSLCSHQRDGVKQVFAGLVDGTLAVVENVQGRIPKPDVFYVIIGSSPVTCLQIVGRRLWCACGSNVVILSARTLDLLDQFQTSSNGLDYIFRMMSGDQGVWITLRGSSILQLWDSHTLTCRLLYDVRENYCSRTSKVDDSYTNHGLITSALPFDGTILVGTADGTLIIYDVMARKSPCGSGPTSPRPQLQSTPPVGATAKQIQERLQKLYLEQQKDHGEAPPGKEDPPLPAVPSTLLRREVALQPMAEEEPEPKADVQDDGPCYSVPLKGPRSRLPPQRPPPKKPEEGSGSSSTSEGGDQEERAPPVPVRLASQSGTLTRPEPKPSPAVPPHRPAPRVAPTDCGEGWGRTHLATDDRPRREVNRMSLLDFRKTGAKLMEAHRRFQSLSAEDLPTWVAKERPEPTLSMYGDVTFRYKRPPALKSFWRDAGGLASFLKVNGAEGGAKRPPTLAPFNLGPCRPLRRRESKDDSHLPWERICVATTPVGIDIMLDTTSDGGQSQGHGRVVKPASAVQNDDGGGVGTLDLCGSQSDLLQLKDWTRTSRKGSDTASNVSYGSGEVPHAFELLLKERIKISDKPIRCLLQASCHGEPTIISCAGYYGDDEAVLKWTKEGEEKLWTNDPIIEVCPYTNTIKPSPYARSRLPRRASIATSSVSDTEGFLGSRAGRSSGLSPASSAGILVESGLAKMQHLLSRVHERS